MRIIYTLPVSCSCRFLSACFGIVKTVVEIDFTFTGIVFSFTGIVFSFTGIVFSVIGIVSTITGEIFVMSVIG